MNVLLSITFYEIFAIKICINLAITFIRGHGQNVNTPVQKTTHDIPFDDSRYVTYVCSIYKIFANQIKYQKFDSFKALYNLSIDKRNSFTILHPKTVNRMRKVYIAQ